MATTNSGMSHWCPLLWTCSMWKAKPKSSQVLVQADSANAVIKSPRIWEVPGIIYLRFQPHLGYTYLQATCPAEEEVNWGPALCALSSCGTKRKLLPEMLAVGNGVAEGSAELVWLRVLGSGDIQLQCLLRTPEYTQGMKLLLLSHSFTLPAAQAGRLRGALQNGVTFAFLSIKILHKIFIVMIITLSFL